MSNTVEFDPGIGQFVSDFNNFINDVYSKMMGFYSISQKRNLFKLYNNKIYSNLENNIAFYQGCLLWAYYIKKQNEKSPKIITGNEFLDLTEEQIADYDFLLQVNFIENYFESYARDTQYYMGKKVSIPDNWKEILDLYKDFLEQNKGFIKTKTTADIVLPSKLNKKSFDIDIKNLIDKAIQKKDLKVLLTVEI